MRKLLLLLFITAGSRVSFAQKTPTPDQLWGPLFTDVQLHRVLSDNKTFVDAIPKKNPADILALYKKQKLHDSLFNLEKFVTDNFILPASPSTKTITQSKTLKQHLSLQWNSLTRKADVKQPYSSLLPLPYPYVVPGGRFREIYYWDSYFTMLGLAASNRYDLIANMLDNFSFLIKEYGHIPNGNRNYYLGRSQPPFFALMVELLHDKKGDKVYKKYLPALEKEYSFWMDGEATLDEGQGYRRVIKLQDGSTLNRYYDDSSLPRQEAYYEDVQTGLAYKGKDGLVYTHLRAAAESGWDFSSRWLEDTLHLTTIETINIIPVDLNCLLYAYETVLSKACKSMNLTRKANHYQLNADNRKKAILKIFWNKELKYFFDYDLKQSSTTNKWSLAGMMPLFVKIANPQQALYAQKTVEQKFLKAGGVATTVYHTSQQWDAPNGWAPLQYITVKGLLNYGYPETAKQIAERWMKVNETVYTNTGKMLEKYNVEDITLKSGGGEYPTQDGFGWTNGVYLKFYEMFRTEHAEDKRKKVSAKP